MWRHQSASALLVLIAVLAVPFTLARSNSTILRGTVEKITHPSPAETHVWLKTPEGPQEVCLGDSRFLAQNVLSPKVGDTIEVTGVQDGSVIVADSIREGNRTFGLYAPNDAEQYQNQARHYCHHDAEHHGHDCYGPDCYGHDCYGHDCEHSHHHCMHID